LLPKLSQLARGPGYARGRQEFWNCSPHLTLASIASLPNLLQATR
jgi:hypothetical protein